MGLDLAVGILADLVDDEEGRAHYRQQLRALNEALALEGLPLHQEPEELGDRHWSCDMWGYSGLHHLRLVAAHLALEGVVPPPCADPADDPVMERYYARATASGKRTLLARLLGRDRGVLPYSHLMLHSDAEGYYLPQDFEAVLVPPDRCRIAGGMVGSASRLLAECRQLATALELPADLDPESDEVTDAAEEQASGDDESAGAGWRRHGIAAYTVLQLIKGCERSLETGAALVFH